MLIYVNGEAEQIAEDASITDLIAHLQLPRDRLAVEHNREVVRRRNWPQIILHEGDRLEVVHFVGGG